MKKRWWHEAVVYQIYLKSFCDSDGDGIGDLKGAMSKLPMLKQLGINCIWFTPIYVSPQVDNGYDVADYYNIDPAYGTLEDFKQLLQQAHSLGIRVVMDQVLNHSSDQCPWFLEAKKSKDNPYRNFYTWHPGKPDGSPPNNWGSYFREGDGSAWEFDETTGEYYLHNYSIHMPELNWEYQPLREEIYKMLRYWLDMGVDGFRLDVFTKLKKPAGFPDSPKQPDPKLDKNGFVVDRSMCTNVEGIHEILHEIYENVFKHYDCMTVGEGAGVNSGNAANYIIQSRGELDTVYHFELSSRHSGPMTAAKYRQVQSAWAKLLEQDAWTTQYLSNHDMPRQVSKHGDDGKYRVESAKLLAVLNHTAHGTPYIFQGEEIGMTNVNYESIADYNCCYTLGDYDALIKNGVASAAALEQVRPMSRDNARTPYQWDDSPNAGFTAGTPWIKVNPNYKDINLAADMDSEDSIFRFYQKLLAMRKDCPAIVDGSYELLLTEHPNVIMYMRRCARQTLLVICNLSGQAQTVELPETVTAHRWQRLLTNREETEASLSGGRQWLPWEAEVYEAIG